MTLTVMMPLAVGIDLGTTNSCIAVYRNKVPEVIVNDEGHRLTESRVFFSDKSETEILVGELAKENECPRNEIFDVKRFIGRKFGDVEDEVKKLYPFKIAKGEDDNVEIEIRRGDGYIYKKPEEISAIILKKLIKAASDTLEDEFNNEAVITVPAYFNNEQRAATKRAAEIAGLKVLRLLNEPTAAAIDYYFKLNNTKDIKKNLVVYDLGGGTFDISIIEITDKRITVKYVGGDTHLGGKNFDDRLYEKYRNEIWSKHGIRIDKKAAKVKRIREHCEKVKKQLSHRKEAKVILSYLDHKTETINFDLKREEFEKINIDLFNKTIKILKDCLYEAKLKPEDIDNVLLVGGSSMIPKIQELLADLFGSNKLQKKCNFEEAVATGAAIQASLLIEDPKKAIEDIILTDVLSESLGTDIEGYKMSVIIKNNTPLPAENTKRYKTIRDNQQFMLIKVLQGNNEDARKNLCLKEMRIEGLTLAPKGEVKIHVKFSVDVNGILQVTATEKLTGKTKKLEIILNKRNM